MSPRKPILTRPVKPNPECDDKMAGEVHADVTMRSASGKSIHEKGARIDSKTVAQFLPKQGTDEQVIEILKKMGVRIVSKGRITICIAAPLEKFQKIFNVELTEKHYFPYSAPRKQKIPDSKACGVYYELNKSRELPVLPELRGLVDQIHLAAPVYFCSDANPPTPGYFHLKVPEDVARLVDAVQCHNHSINGSGIVLAMPDQGTFTHEYYTARGYNITVDETAYDSTADTGSHGTAIAANALAVAPGVNFIGIRNGAKLSSATAAFQQAVSHNPNIISISWGITSDSADLRADVSLAISDGITICAACGNAGDLVFPSSMPEVISVGGTYADVHDVLTTSPYASSGILTGVDAGRQMPDLTGYVGPAPHGVYITLPCHPSSDEDTYFAGGAFPDKDETAADDGWLVASGTSSATPQVAGVVALLMQADPSFVGHPALVKQRLLDSAVDVTSGASANAQNAAAGVDNATGHGVVDAFRAVNRVDVWIKDNLEDTGLVPIKGLHYISPDIKVLAAPLGINPSEADFDAAVHISQPVYGTTYHVYIKARNRGYMAANGVTVKFYYTDPATFTTFPADWHDGQSGVPAEGSIMVGPAHTNVIPIASILANSAKVAGPFTWLPPNPSGASWVGTTGSGQAMGHFCLLTRLECPADPITYTSGAQSTVWLDNNIGMKNLWVIEPEMSTPLLIGGMLDVKESKLIINLTGDLVENKLMLIFPKELLHATNKRNKLLVLKTGKKGEVEVSLAKGKPVKSFEIRLIPKPRGLLRLKIMPPKIGLKIKGEISVHVGQYADGKCVGGAGFLINPKRVK